MASRASIPKALVIVLSLAFLTGCGPKLFEPIALDPSMIPAAVQFDWQSHSDWSGFQWHVAEKQDGHMVYAYTYSKRAPDGVVYRWYVAAADGLGGGGGAIDTKQPFGGMKGTSGPSVDGDGNLIPPTIGASGYCFDRRVTTVVGKTTEGREFSATVSNGFWWFYCPDPNPSPGLFGSTAEQWSEITARNGSGKVLYRLPM